jgi:hypothetical protein
MIDPGSMGDWLQTSVVAGLVGAAAALFLRALRSEERRPSVMVVDEECTYPTLDEVRFAVEGPRLVASKR